MSTLDTVQINDAVVTVPAYFNDSQRQATKDAGAPDGRTGSLRALRFGSEEPIKSPAQE